MQQTETNTSFDAVAELSAARRWRAAGSQRRRWRESRLDHYKRELLALRQAGASLGELRAWLRSQKRISVARSTISRWLKREADGPLR